MSVVSSDDDNLNRAIIAYLEQLFAELTKQIAQMQDTMSSFVNQSEVERSLKSMYTVAEFAKLVKKARYTVRQWCHDERINAEKAGCGRGLDCEWRITHAELIRYNNEGLLPKRPDRDIRFKK